jgi:lysine-N-methylase
MPLPVRSLPVLQNWDCHACSECCREYRVILTDEERARILSQNWEDDPDVKGLKLMVRDGWFSRRYRLNHLADGSCVFLNEQGLCRIHAKFGSEGKPLACRVYPFTLVPIGDHWRVGMRFACPSATNNRGRAVAAHEPDIRRYAAAIEERECIPESGAPTPLLGKGQAAPWSDIIALIRTLRLVVADERRPLEWRLRKCLALVNLCRESHFEAISGTRLKEFLSVIGEGINSEVPAHPEAISPPRWIGRVLFRQALAIYVRKDAGKNRGVSRRGRIALLRAAFRFAMGRGHVPRLHGLIPETTFEKIEASTGPLSEESTQLLMRYYVVKIESGQFFGPTNFRRRFWDGFESLILTYPAIRWLARAMNDRPPNEAIALAVGIVDDNFGYNPLLGSRRQLLGTRMLGRRGELTNLVAWYSR